MTAKTYLIHQDNPEDFRVIAQAGVKQALVHDPVHNASWDGNLSPEGQLYFSLCSELTTHDYAKLCTYDFDSNTISECFYTRDYLLKQDRYIRDSKFHTCISFLPDGKLIMVTHTTDKSPSHPAWLPYAYVANPWEGYPGGELIEYDPRTGKVDLLGIPAPRESIYGGVYSAKDDCYYMLGYMRGHLYQYNRQTRKCTDLGQASEYHCYRLAVGPDQNIYFSTRSGFMMRYNIDAGKIEDLKVRLCHDKDRHVWPYTYLGPCLNGPDGRMYMTGNFTDKLSVYDPQTGELTCAGRMILEDEYVDQDQQHMMIPAMDFDQYGVLWYSTMSFRDNEDEYYKVPAMLMRWDLLRGGKPECLGVLGTPERAGTFSVSLFIDKQRDILYSVSTNHSKDAPDIIAVDLTEFRPRMSVRGPICRDRLLYKPGAAEYHEFGREWHQTKACIKQNTSVMKTGPMQVFRLWQQVPMEQIADAAVIGLAWDDRQVLHGLSGQDNPYHFTISDGRLTSFDRLSHCDANLQKWLAGYLQPVDQETPGQLPGYPGRMFKAKPQASCQWHDGRRLVGTEDGFLALCGQDGTYALGPATAQGPIRCLCTDASRRIAYGVGGDVEDIGNVFRYDDANGLQWLGYLATDLWDDDTGACANFVLSACALSADGRRLAIGASDRLACVYIMNV